MRVPLLSAALAGCLAALIAQAGLPGPATAAGREAASSSARPSLGLPRADVRECKPQGPLALDVAPLAAPDAEGRLELAVETKGFVPLEDVRLRVLLPDGAELLDDPAGLLAERGGWTVAPRLDAHASGADAGVLGRARPGAASAREPAAADRRPLRVGERAAGRLALRLPTWAADLELVLEAEGSFDDGRGGVERVVVQRALVWGEPEPGFGDDELVVTGGGALRREVACPVSHRER